MLVAILHPAVAPDASPEDQDTLVQVEMVRDALTRLGHDARSLTCTLDLAALRDDLLQLRPDVVFNLAESLEGTDSLQYVPTAVLDVLGLPYTGAPTEATFQTTHKLLAKQLLRLAGLPTPAHLASVAEGGGKGDSPHLPRPAFGRCPPSGCCAQMGTAPFSTPPTWIIKAVWEHASHGLDEENVITAGEDSVRERLAQHAARTGRPCFAEQFIAGREFNLALLDGPDGPEVLPCAEIDFSAFPPGKPRIVGHRAKWSEDSFEFHHTPQRYDFPPEDRPLLERLRQLALACWHLFGLRGYARVDFRVDVAGQPWILEVNTNPCLSPDAGFAAALAEAGISFERAVERILAMASPVTAPETTT